MILCPTEINTRGREIARLKQTAESYEELVAHGLAEAADSD